MIFLLSLWLDQDRPEAEVVRRDVLIQHAAPAAVEGAAQAFAVQVPVIAACDAVLLQQSGDGLHLPGAENRRIMLAMAFD